MQIKLGNQTYGPQFAYTDAANHCRTDAQYKALMAFTADPANNVAFWSSDSLKPEFAGQKFNCTFYHHYFDNAGNYRLLAITPTGRLKPVGKE